MKRQKRSMSPRLRADEPIPADFVFLRLFADLGIAERCKVNPKKRALALRFEKAAFNHLAEYLATMEIPEILL